MIGKASGSGTAGDEGVSDGDFGLCNQLFYLCLGLS